MGQMHVMGPTGDVVIQWDPTDGPATDKARKEWDALKRSGFEFYEAAEAGSTAKRVKQWDPDRGKVIAAPGVQKPAERKTGTRSGAMAGGPVAERREGSCPNPFCDGLGNIDVSVKMTGRSRTYGTCGVGPHPA